MSQFKISHRPARYCSTRIGETIPPNACPIGHLPRHKSGHVAPLELWDGNLKRVAADVRGELPGIAGVVMTVTPMFPLQSTSICLLPEQRLLS
jgi:hypothetical protein